LVVMGSGLRAATARPATRRPRLKSSWLALIFT
jgi:hypothetical protein